MKANSLLDKISVNNRNLYVTNLWANGMTGAIVDINGEYIYRFVEYINTGTSVREKYPTDEDKLSCPIVACGIVGYWLRHKGTKGVKTLFNDYNSYCKALFEKEHENDDDAWERNLEHEFINKEHIQEEKKRILKSQSLFPYLTKTDITRIQSVSNNYLKFARSKRRALQLQSIPSEKRIEYPFLAAYIHGGAHWCIKWFREEYNLPLTRPKSHAGEQGMRRLEGIWKKRHDVDIPEFIQEEFDDFDDSVLTLSNGGLMDEIHQNIEKCYSYEDRTRYITSLLQPFKSFADAFCVRGLIQNLEKAIDENQSDLEKWKAVPADTINKRTGKPLDTKAQLKSCESLIEQYKKEIEYQRFVESQFFVFIERCSNREYGPNDNQPMFVCLQRWYSLMIRFSHSLAALALTYGIKLMDIQEQCSIYINWSFIITDYVDDKFISSIEQAEYLLAQIPSKDTASIKESEFEKILDCVYTGYTSLEKLPPKDVGLDEVSLRNHIVVLLHSHGYVATAESFNRKGKTDICIKDENGNNLFIAECKIWHGEKHFHAAVSQLFSYLTWRDKKVALIIYVESGNFTQTIQRVKQSIGFHPLFVRHETHGRDQENSFSCVLHHQDDKNCLIELEILLFHFPNYTLDSHKKRKSGHMKILSDKGHKLTRDGQRLTANVLKGKIADHLLSRDSNGTIGKEVMYGSSRRVADMVFISKGHSYAIEIKSEFDTLARLEGQLQDYQSLFDYILVFSAPNHIDTLKAVLPDYAGLYSISEDGIQRIRRERINRHVQKSEILISIPSATVKSDFSVKGKLTSDEIRKVVKNKSFKTIHDYFINYYILRLNSGSNKLDKLEIESVAAPPENYTIE